MSKALNYLSWVRQGLATAISEVSGKRAQFEVNLAITLDIEACKTQPIKVSLYGPGDVLSLDLRQINRTEPEHLAPAFEPNYFPFIEFDRPDLPWLFTPAAPDKDGHLSPWICLVVVERREGVSIIYPNQGQAMPPVLHIENNAQDELPPLEDAWAWAHTQVTWTGAHAQDTDSSGSELKVEEKQLPSPDELQKLLLNEPKSNLSRLLCPRKLKPRTTYYACVVPTYKAGVQAGLGQKVVANPEKPNECSWNNDTDSIDLPIYYHWEFSTGAEGDFEALVRRLERRSLKDVSAEVGIRPLVVDDAGVGLPDIGTIGLGGALRVVYESEEVTVFDSVLTLSRPANYPAFQEELRKALNGTSSTVKNLTPLLPPIYGRWHAAQREIPETSNSGRNARWLRQLNLDPRYRIAAGLGTQVVQKHQEELMTAAWKQVGAIIRANQMLSQAQLAREASNRLHQDHLSKMDPETVVLITAPVHTKVAADSDNHTVYKIVAESKVPTAVFSAAFRRLTRSRGPLARRAGTARNTNWTARLLRRINAGEIEVMQQPAPKPNGMVDIKPGKIFGDDSPKMCELTSLFDEEHWSTIKESFNLAADEYAGMPEKASVLLDEIYRIIGALNSTDPKHVKLKQIHYELSPIPNELTNLKNELKSIKFGSLVDVLERLNIILATSRDLSQMLVTINGQILNEINDDKLDLTSLGFSYIGPLRDKIESSIKLLQPALLRLSFARLQETVEKCDPKAYLPPARPALKIEALSQKILFQLNPALTITRRMGKLIEAPGWQPEDPLEPVMAAPEFPAPMYKHLADLSPDWLLPGLDRVPTNSVSIVSANKHFIEAYMVGLNHEMGRELLWRGYPTDQRGTYFHQFWDVRSRIPAPISLQDGYDIKVPISDWYKPKDQYGDKDLGEHLASASNAPLVLLIRGELLQRYPRAIIYFEKAKKTDVSTDPDATKKLIRKPDPNGKKFYPDFFAKLEPDITFIGFANLDKEKARGDNFDPGYFLVIQQQPTEPRYGLDLEPPENNKKTGIWRDLAWTTVLPEDKLKAGAYISLRLKNWPNDFNPPNNEWRNSAELAAITRQPPFRIAIHASDLLPASGQ